MLLKHFLSGCRLSRLFKKPTELSLLRKSPRDGFAEKTDTKWVRHGRATGRALTGNQERTAGFGRRKGPEVCTGMTWGHFPVKAQLAEAGSDLNKTKPKFEFK